MNGAFSMTQHNPSLFYEGASGPSKPNHSPLVPNEEMHPVKRFNDIDLLAEVRLTDAQPVR